MHTTFTTYIFVVSDLCTHQYTAFIQKKAVYFSATANVNLKLGLFCLTPFNVVYLMSNASLQMGQRVLLMLLTSSKTA